MNYLNAAIEYHKAGLKVIPFWSKPDGLKSFPPDYARYRDSQTEADVQALFTQDCDGVCLLCTDGIEVIDIDVKHDPKKTILRDLMDSLDNFDFEITGVVQATKSGGAHIIYRCPQPDGNTKLARRRGSKEAIIETRGRGGLLFVAPTPGYEVTYGDLKNIPAVSQQSRDYLIKICRHFDEPEPVEFKTRNAQPLDGKTPWDDFDAKTDILQMMFSYGWSQVGKVGDYIRLNRPGAKHSRGVDGTVIESANLFYPFTTSEAFESEKAYTPSAVYAVLECRNDFSEAARQLYRKGFGDRIEKKEQAEVKQELPGLVGRVEKTRFDVHKEVKEKQAILTFDADRTYPVAGRGMIGVFTGHEKSGKSFVASCIAASAIARGREVLNFHLDLLNGKMIYFDTEQSGYFYHKTQQRIFQIAGVEDNVPHYAAYHLRQLSPLERLEVIEHYIYNTPDLVCVVVDGLVDLLKDYNNLEQVQDTVQRLMRWTDEKQILLMGILHVNKGDGKIRGHLGSEIKNKCDLILNVQQPERNQYQVSNPAGRYAAIPSLDFCRDDDGLPQYAEAEINKHFSTFQPTPAPAWQPPRQEPVNDEDIPF